MTAPPTVLLVHGGLYEDMDAGRFWVAPGIASGLAGAGYAVLAPDRVVAPRSWAEEAGHLATVLAGAGVPRAAVVAGSNGCSVAVRLAIDHPDRVVSLVLCWPATAGDDAVDAGTRAVIEAAAGSETADVLLGGETLRGVADAELAALPTPVGLIPSIPDPYHQPHTAGALVRLVPGLRVGSPYPGPPRSDFAEAREAFVAELLGLLEQLGGPGS